LCVHLSILTHSLNLSIFSVYLCLSFCGSISPCSVSVLLCFYLSITSVPLCIFPFSLSFLSLSLRLLFSFVHFSIFLSFCYSIFLSSLFFVSLHLHLLCQISVSISSVFLCFYLSVVSVPLCPHLLCLFVFLALRLLLRIFVLQCIYCLSSFIYPSYLTNLICIYISSFTPLLYLFFLFVSLFHQRCLKFVKRLLNIIYFRKKCKI